MIILKNNFYDNDIQVLTLLMFTITLFGIRSSPVRPVSLFGVYFTLNSFDTYYNIVWNKEAPLKISFFAWRLLRNRISTTDNLTRRQNLWVGGCGKHEDIDHLFLSCDFFEFFWYF